MSNKKSLLILMTIIFTSYSISAQEKNKSKVNIIAVGGIGYGIIENESEPNYNLNSNGAEILLNYNFSERFGIATGIGVNQLTGNGFNTLGEFYQERNILKIPLVLTLHGSVSENIEFFGNLGFFSQKIVKDNYRFLMTSRENIYEGWNFGVQLGIGILFNLINEIQIGVAINAQSDLSKFKSNDSVINDKQKMKSLSRIGLILKYNL